MEQRPIGISALERPTDQSRRARSGTVATMTGRAPNLEGPCSVLAIAVRGVRIHNSDVCAPCLDQRLDWVGRAGLDHFKQLVPANTLDLSSRLQIDQRRARLKHVEHEC